jgi:hypothetical protein
LTVFSKPSRGSEQRWGLQDIIFIAARWACWRSQGAPRGKLWDEP